MAISKPTVGLSGWNTSVDATIDGVNAHDAAVGYTGTSRGVWAGSIAYSVADVITSDAGVFRCTVAHTSNPAGFRYDREKWEQLPLPVLGGGTTVPVRQLTLTDVGTGSVNPPRAGVFQHKPKQFNYAAEKLLWAPQAANDVTTSGGLSGATTGTQVGGSVALTSGGSSEGYARSATFTTTVDITGGHLRIPIKVSLASGRYVGVWLTSSGTDYTNCHRADVMSGNIDGFRETLWTMVSIPVSELTTVGTGADLTAINGIRFSLYPAGAFTCEISKVGWHPNSADKAKVVLWLDDGGFPNQLSAIKVAAKYGFPVTVAAIGDNLVNAGGGISADQARYLQDHLNGQLAVHAFGGSDHNRVQTGAQVFEQLLDYQHFGRAMGFHGVEDAAYWNTGFNNNNAADADVTVRKMFRSTRGGRSRLPETLPPGDPGMTRAVMTGAGNTSTGTFQPFVTRAVACKGLAQFVWHDLDTTTLAEFTTFCAWLDTQRANVQVVTAKQAFDPLTA